ERASRASTAREACARQAPSERCVSPVETARLEIVYTLVVSGVRIPPSPLRWRAGDDEGARSDVAAAVRSERCPSGRRGTPGERVYLHRYRGFESLPLRSACAFLAPPLPSVPSRGIGRWWLGPAQDGVANPARSGRKQRYRMSLCAAGHPSHHRRMPRPPTPAR